MKSFYEKEMKFTKPTVKLLLGVFSFLALMFSNQNTQAQTYCTTSLATNGNLYYVDSIRTIGGISNIVHLNNNPIVVNSNGYTDLTTQVVSGLQGNSFQLNLHGRQLYQYHWNVFIDWNQNGSFGDPGELVYSYITGTQIQSTSVTVNIPPAATPGNTRMRVAMYRISNTSDPCIVSTSVMGYITDFTVNVLPLTPCTNPAAGGTAILTPAGQACPGTPVTLGLTGITLAGGQTYEWESSPNNTIYTSMGAATPSPDKLVTPLTTTWYRCKVVCSNGTPAYSLPIQVTLATPLNGVYTINNASPTAGTNFASFTDAINKLNCAGVSGQVTFNVNPTTPYVETLNLGVINGVSQANYVKFNGNGATVQYNNTTTERQLLTLSGSKYVTIDNINFVSLSTSVGWGALITSGAEKDSITNCIFDLSANTSIGAATNVGIAFSGSNSTATTAGLNGKNCYIANNLVKGANGTGGMYYGISIPGGGNDSNIVKNNTIENHYYYAIYIAGGLANVIENNKMHKTNKTASFTTGYFLYTTGTIDGTKITGNKIYNTSGPSGNTGSLYGYYLLGDGTAANPVLFSNNIIYNINNSGILYPIYLSTALQNKVYHNTIVIDQMLTGTSTNYGIYSSGTNTGTELKNNNVSITAGSGGIKYGFYYSTAASIVDAQKNNYYVNSTQAGVQNYGYYAAAYLTQAAFQTAYPALELGSPSVNSSFVAASTGNLLPTNTALLSAGVNLITTVPTDINNTPRSSTPTLGAFESLPTNVNDASTQSILNPTGLFCSGSRPVEVVIRNAGSNNLNSLQVNWSVNGVLQTPIPYTSVLVPSNATTGQNMDTLILGNANLISGANTISVWTSLPNGVADINTTNDSVNTSISTASFVATALSDTTCAGTPVMVNLSPASGYTNEIITWQQSSNGTSWTTIASASTSSLTVPSIGASTFFRANISNGNIVCNSSSDQVVYFAPAITSSTPAQRCGSGTLTLSATGSSGNINWYNVATGGTPIQTGTTFTTPSIATTTTYYAAASSGGSGGSGGFVGKTTFTPTPTSGAGTTNYGLVFDVIAPCILDSVTIFPVSASSASGTVTIDVINGSGTVIHTTTVNVVGSPTASPTPQRVALGFNLAPGTNYKLRPGSYTGITGLLFDPSANAPAGNYGYPFVLPGFVSINHSTLTAAPTNTQRLDLYYYFYNWSIRTSGCESTRVPVVATINPAPVVNLGNDKLICPGTTTTLNATAPTGTSYAWSTGATTPSITVGTAGTYIVTVGNSTSCTTKDTIVVGIAPVPTIALQDTVKICNGTSATLNAGNPGATFSWNTGSTSQSITTQTTGNYVVNVTNSNQCSAKDSSYVVVNPLPVVHLGNDTMVCSGSTIILNAQNPGSTYLWSTNATTQSIQVTTAGNYSVVVTNGFGCVGKDTITVNAFVPVSVDGFNFIPRFDIQQGRVDFTPINPILVNNYHWNFGDGTTSTLQNPSHVYSTSANYLVTLSVANECGSKDTSLMIYVDLQLGVRFANSADIKIDVYPVPAQESLTIECLASEVKLNSVSIYNAIGQEMILKQNINNSKTTINTNGLTTGNYFIKIETNKGTAFRRVNILK